jgi:hypothetical protein
MSIPPAAGKSYGWRDMYESDGFLAGISGNRCPGILHSVQPDEKIGGFPCI